MENPEIYICDAEAKHIRQMSTTMDSRTAETALRLGITPGKALWRSYKESLFCRAAFINGKLTAIWGLGGVMFGEVGKPWLVMTPEANDYPFKVAFIYKRELKKMATMFPVLEDYVDETHKKAVRMLELMGFKMDGEKLTIGDVNLLRAERRA